ncbi:MAG TPA: tripartite tricarboxylate transporter TctB family protein [Pseudoneobacillus sp.]|nr:tripartite tricarboxylate transporter TctB family protein [Pseudoneobacillus sp.]
MKRTANLCISIMLIVVAVLTINVAATFPSLEGTDVGAAYFPKMLSFILIGLSILLFIQSLREPKSEQSDSSSQTNNWKKTFLGIVGTIVYTFIFHYIGFYIATILFLFAMMWMLGFKKIVVSIILSIGITLFIYVVFEMLLQVPIPKGVLFE